MATAVMTDALRVNGWFGSLSKQESPQASLSQDQDAKVNNLVKYLLIMDQKKMPIKKSDINKNVLKEDSKVFSQLIAEAGKRLSIVFGIQLKELEDKHKGQYILVNKVELEENQVKWPDEDNCKLGLLTVVLSLIFMNGNVMEDGPLWSALKKFGVDPDVPNEAFGDVKKLLTQEFVRQCYLEITRQPNTDPPVSEFRWGQRAFLETSKENILNFVSQIYGTEPYVWKTQWQEIQAANDEPVAGASSSSCGTAR